MDPDTLLIEIEENLREGVDGNTVQLLGDMINWLASGGACPKRLRTQAQRDKFAQVIADAADELENADDE